MNFRQAIALVPFVFVTGCADATTSTATDSDPTTTQGDPTTTDGPATESTTDAETDASETEASTAGPTETSESETTDATTDMTTDATTDMTTDATTDMTTDVTTDASETGVDTDPDPLEISGTYTDSFDGTHDIDDNEWLQTYGDSSLSFVISWYDNDAAYLVAQNGEANEFNPGLWSKFEWTTTQDDRLWYCQTAFDAASAEEAEAAPEADPNDPETTGCSGFPWTELIPG